MKKRKLIIVLIIVAVLAVTGIVVFRERPLMPEGYSLEHVGGGMSFDGEERYRWDESRTMIEYNPDYPNGNTPGYSVEYITISTDELEEILRTAKVRVSLNSYAPYFLGDVKYRFSVVLVNDDKVRHSNICIGLKSWDSRGPINYDIKNAEALIEALDAATTIEYLR